MPAYLSDSPGIGRRFIQQYSHHLVNRLLSPTRNPTAHGRVFPDTGLIPPIRGNRFAYREPTLAMTALTLVPQPL